MAGRATGGKISRPWRLPSRSLGPARPQPARAQTQAPAAPGSRWSAARRAWDEGGAQDRVL